METNHDPIARSVVLDEPTSREGSRERLTVEWIRAKADASRTLLRDRPTVPVEDEQRQAAPRREHLDAA